MRSQIQIPLNETFYWFPLVIYVRIEQFRIASSWLGPVFVNVDPAIKLIATAVAKVHLASGTCHLVKPNVSATHMS
jgi:hypothetical protein